MKSDGLKKSYKEFIKKYFSDSSGVDILYNALIDGGDYTKSIKSFYLTFACDLSWAKNGTYCKSSVTPVTPVNPAPPIGGGGNSGGGNSGGGRVSRRYHDCPTGPYTQGCRSEVVRKVQKCIGVKDDSLFGPITQGALESKGFKNGFTDADVSKLCSNDSEENKPTVVLPDWTTCLKILKKVSLSRDYDNVEIVMVPFANDKGYFWPTKEFLYLYKSGKEIRGSWSCDNSRLIIKTEDGQMWSETNGWETSVRRNNNNDDNNNNNNNNNINYQDDYTTYDDNEDNYE